MYSTGYHDDIEGRNGRDAVADVLTSTPTVPVPVKRWWPFTSGSDRNNDNYDNDNDNYGYQDKCKSNDEEDCSGWDCRHHWDANRRTTPTPRVWARNYPNDQYNSNYPQATPGVQNGNYGNYKNYGSSQNYPTDGQSQDQNLKATGGEKQ
ncbi:hypothetical protein N7488_012040 [Penicillium malachiteum]|nr:hypothetical protein N7488_012040 [Penicillium malachiteum]